MDIILKIIDSKIIAYSITFVMYLLIMLIGGLANANITATDQLLYIIIVFLYINHLIEEHGKFELEERSIARKIKNDRMKPTIKWEKEDDYNG